MDFFNDGEGHITDRVAGKIEVICIKFLYKTTQ